MQISSAIAQLRTTDLAASIDFYTTKMGLTLEFQYQDFYAGIRAGSQLFHLKLVDEKDPSMEFPPIDLFMVSSCDRRYGRSRLLASVL